MTACVEALAWQIAHWSDDMSAAGLRSDEVAEASVEGRAATGGDGWGASALSTGLTGVSSSTEAAPAFGGVVLATLVFALASLFLLLRILRGLWRVLPRFIST